jgi:TonB-linked SusC/RagA family outer membrane protein
LIGVLFAEGAEHLIETQIKVNKMKNRYIEAFLAKSMKFSRGLSIPQSLRVIMIGVVIIALLFPVCAIFASRAQANLAMQQVIVKGIVRNSMNNEPIEGVNVIVKGTALGTATNSNGEYSIQVPGADAVLVFSFVGYDTEEIPVNGQATVDAYLVASSKALDEIIVVAYGTTKRSNLTGSAVAIKSEELKDVFAPNVSSMIQGKVAGVYARVASGRPGTTASLNIRGKGSLSNTNSPLWVLDGVIIGNSEPSINPSDVESVTVLKDASATSLYGSLAANGVILVQTKKAAKGTSKVSVSATRGYTNLNLGNFSLMNAQELYDYHKSWDNSSWFNESLLDTDTDWWKLGTQTGVAQEYNVNYAGSTDKMTSFISGTYYKETGAFKGYEWEQCSAIANFEMQANSRLKLKLNLTGNYSNTLDQEHDFYSLTTYLPWDRPYLPDGTPLHPKIEDHKTYLTSIGKQWYGRDESNYLYDLQYNWYKGRGNNFRVNGGFDFKINDWLTFTSANYISLGFSNSQSYTDPRSMGGLADNGLYSQGYSFSKTRSTNQLLRFTREFDKHSVTAFGAYEYRDTYYDDNDATGKGIAAGLQTLNTTAEAKDVSGYKSESAMQSILFNVQYVFDSRYMATASFSRQGSSSFGPNNKYGNFWSASAGWNLHNEGFVKPITWINQLKLAASMGQVGNAPGGFQYLGYYELTGQYNGIPAARPYQKGNPDISWEKITTYNLSLSSRLFNRLDLNLDVYNKDSKDLLAWVPLPAMVGYSGVWMNVGRIVNKGFELSLHPEIVKTKNFEWDITFNLAYNKNEIKELYENNPYQSGNFRREVGYDMDSYYQRVWYGVNPGNGLPLYEKVVEDAEGNKTIELVSTHDQATLQHTGKKGSPTYTGGILTSVRAFDFTLSANIGFVEGIYLYNSSRELFDSDGSYPTFNQMNLAKGWSRWEKPGDIATHPKPRMGGVDANKNSTRYLEDASFIRLRNVTLNYQVPGTFAKRVLLSDASVYLSLDNMLTKTKWSGLDPEAPTYPLTKKVMLGIRFSF